MIQGLLLLLLVTGLTGGAFIRSDQRAVNHHRVPRPRTYHSFSLPRRNLYDIGVSPFHFLPEQIGPSPFFTEAAEDNEDNPIDEERVEKTLELEDTETEQPNSEYYKEWILQNLG